MLESCASTPGATGILQGGKAIVYISSTSIGSVRSLVRCSGLPASHCSVFLDMSPKPILARTKGARRINKALLPVPGLPTWSFLASVDLGPGCLRHLLSYWPVKNMQHTLSTQNLFLYQATTGKESYFV